MSEAEVRSGAVGAGAGTARHRCRKRRAVGRTGVSREPESPDFSFSVGGIAYFVVGLHPGASRAARRFCRPALVFNPHEQFERLRSDGRYYAMQSIIREREIARHGSINPMLSDFGIGPRSGAVFRSPCRTTAGSAR